MHIRKATLDDFTELYAMGKNTPELKVSATEEFMDEDEFRWSIDQPRGVFLLAENERILGFVYANANDQERPFAHKYACIVYLAVIPGVRGMGVGKALYDACAAELKSKGCTNIYSWADPESGIVEFFKKQGFAEGKPSIWMDKEI